MIQKLCLALAFSTLALYSQGTASLSGRITDTSGASVPNASITATNQQTGRKSTAASSDTGLFVVPSLPAGPYEVLIEKPGFQSIRQTRVQLAVGGSVNLDFVLKPGEVASSVTVEAEPVEIDRDVMGTGTVVDRRFVRDLPLNGRSFQSLIELAPGTVLARSSIQSPGQFSVNGQRSNGNYFLIDGVSGNTAASSTATFSQQAAGTLPGLTVLGGTNSLVMLDALQEFRVQTSSFAPEYGRSPGAQIIMLTRSGANRFHSSAFYDLRNEKLDANDWFANASGRGRAPFRLNQFGGTFSGPVRIPKLYNGADRTFFFFAYEGLRLREPQFARAQVPTESARNRASGPIRELLNAFPLPNAPSPFTNPDQGLYEAAYSDPAKSNIASLRLDQNLGRAGTLFFRFNIAPNERQSRAFVNQYNATYSESETYTGGWSWAPRPTLVSELRANWTAARAGFDFQQIPGGGATPIPDSLIFPAYTDRNRASASISLAAFLGDIRPANLTQGRSIGNEQRQFNILENLTWVRGAHTMKFGADLRFLLPIAAFREYGISYMFGTITNAIDTQTATVQVQALAPRGGFTLPGYGFFAQDTWRVNPRLTLTYGLRWEFVPPPRTDSGRPIYRLDQVDNLLTAQLATPGTRLWDTRWTNLEPRLGVSYLVSDAHSLVFKAGFGIFHDLGTGQASRGFNGYPYNSVRNTMNVRFPAPAAVLEPLPFNAAPPYSSEFFITDPNLKQPYTLQWSAGFEKNFRDLGTADVRYVANAGRRLLFNEYLRNRPALGNIPARTILNPAIFGPLAPVNLTRNFGESDYHSLQAQFRRRFAAGFQAQLSYTWSKALDNISDETTIAGPVEFIDRTADRGPSVFDVRHNFVAAVTTNPTRGRGPLGLLWGNWALDTFFRARTATPVNVIAGVDISNIGVTTVNRPDLVPGVPLYIESAEFPGGRRINPGAFQAPAPGTQGNLGRNALRGLNALQWDLAVRRRFSVTEGLRLDFRADFFNVLNRANFGDPSGQLAFGATPNPTFGISQTLLNRSLSGSGGLSPLFQVGGPRSIQFGLRLEF
jgi:hypothetical protein